jgi:hypothetical protein
MKLLMCGNCRDLIPLAQRTRTCRCKGVSGKYLRDGLHAEVQGDGLLFGINSNDLIRALAHRDRPSVANEPVRAWVIPSDAANVRWTRNDPAPLEEGRAGREKG